jgi:tRNA (mo5U34)-methyltransferase
MKATPRRAMNGPGAPAAAEAIAVTAAERAVADLLPIEADPGAARAVLEEAPFWFHTFALNRAEDIYTPGAARDHRYRIPALPADLSGQSVLDVGAFDGFYSFLAEARGAERVLAVDSEQYRDWVRARWGVRLEGGEGFRAIKRLLGSRVEYRRLDAFELDRLDERFDLAYCFGILHRVENPLGLLRVLRGRLAGRGRMLVETYGVAEELRDDAAVHVPAGYAVYPGDEFVYWGFTRTAVARLAGRAGFAACELLAEPVIDGHPRILARLAA